VLVISTFSFKNQKIKGVLLLLWWTFPWLLLIGYKFDAIIIVLTEEKVIVYCFFKNELLKLLKCWKPLQVALKYRYLSSNNGKLPFYKLRTTSNMEYFISLLHMYNVFFYKKEVKQLYKTWRELWQYSK
jgi:hypothetical protein